MEASRAGGTGIRAERVEFVKTGEVNASEIIVGDVVKSGEVNGSEKMMKDVVEEIDVNGREKIVEEFVKKVEINGSENIVEDFVKADGVNRSDKILEEDFVREVEVSESEKIVENYVKAEDVNEREKIVDDSVIAEKVNESKRVIEDFEKGEDVNESKKEAGDFVKAEEVNESEKIVDDIMKSEDVSEREEIVKRVFKEVEANKRENIVEDLIIAEDVNESKRIVEDFEKVEDVNGSEKDAEDLVKAKEVKESDKIVDGIVKAGDANEREYIVKGGFKELESNEREIVVEDLVIAEVNESEIIVEDFVKVGDVNGSKKDAEDFEKVEKFNGSKKIVDDIVKAEDANESEEIAKKVLKEGEANERDKFLEEFVEEVEVKNHGQRTEVFMVMLVVAVYLLCQAAVVFAGTNAGFWAPLGYSDDLDDLPANNIDHEAKHRIGLEALCLEGGNVSDSQRNASSVPEEDLKFLVLNAVRDRANISVGEEATSVVTVYYCACGSRNKVISGQYLLEDGTLIEIHDDDTGDTFAGDTDFTTFLHARSGQSVAISYVTEKKEYMKQVHYESRLESVEEDENEGEGGERAKKGKKDSAEVGNGLSFAITCLKLLIPVPIAAALLVYLGFPTLRRRRQGKIILCKLSSELVISSSPWTGRAPAAVFASSFALVAGLTWTTVLCYDLWSSCGDGGLRRASQDRALDRRKFFRYSVVGWGHAVLSGGVAAFCKQSRQQYSVLMAVMFVVYFFLNVLNLMFFAFTVAHVRRHNAKVLSLIRRGRKGPKAAHGPYLYFRITVLTGILSFFFELFDIFALGSVMSDAVGDCHYFSILGLSLLDKTLYFVILVCNSRVLGLLKKFEIRSR